MNEEKRIREDLTIGKRKGKKRNNECNRGLNCSDPPVTVLSIEAGFSSPKRTVCNC
jgi:hypothetical protein